MRTDIRFRRIAVSIFDTHPLNRYFGRLERMKRATIYCDVSDEWEWTEDIIKIAEFLETLYNKEPSKLVHLLSYIINDLLKLFNDFYSGAGLWSRASKRDALMRDLSWFFYELETIGISWDGAKFSFTVGTTNLDIEIHSRLESMLSKRGAVIWVDIRSY